MHQKLFRKAAGGILLLTTFLFCREAAAIDDHTPRSGVKIGAIYGLSGPLADFSKEYKNGAELFMRHHRLDKDFSLSVIFEDSKWEPKTAVSAFKKLVDVDHVRVVHVMGSSTSLAIKPLSEQSGVFLFSAGAHPDILKDSSLIIRHANIASNDARILADDIFKRLPTANTIASIYLQNDWGESYNREFEKSTKSLRPNVKLIAEPHLPDSTDFKSQLLKLMAQRPDVIMVNSSGPSAGLIIKQYYQMGFKVPLFANNGVVLSETSLNILRQAKIQGFYYQVYPPVNEEFSAEYQSLFGKKPDYLALSAYDDYELIHQAVQSAGPEPKALVDFIKHMGQLHGKYETLNISPDGDILINTSVEVFR